MGPAISHQPVQSALSDRCSGSSGQGACLPPQIVADSCLAPMPVQLCCSLADFAWKKIKDKSAAGFASQQQPQQQQQQRRQPSPLRRLLSLQQRRPAPPPLPPPRLPKGRWKAAVTQLGGMGMVIHGGDAPAKKAEVYLDDTWLLGFPGLRWQQGEYGTEAPNSSSSTSGSSSGGSTAYPQARREHSLVSYQVRTGLPCLLTRVSRVCRPARTAPAVAVAALSLTGCTGHFRLPIPAGHLLPFHLAMCCAGREWHAGAAAVWRAAARRHAAQRCLVWHHRVASHPLEAAA